MRELIERVNEFAASLAEAMLGVAWQSALLAAGVGVVCWALRWQSPGLRYWLWLALAAKLLALPLWSVDVAGPRWWGEFGSGARGESHGAASMVDESTMPRGDVGRGGDAGAIEQSKAALTLDSEPAWHRSATWATWLLAAWLAGVAFEVGRTGWQFAGLRRLLAGSIAAEPSVEIVVEQCAARLGLLRLPAVRVVDGEGSPMVCGVWRATLVLPAALVEEVDRPALRQIVLHELAHVQRRDLLTVWVIHLMRTIYWFNPVAHWVAYRAGLERELACDRLAMVNSGASAAAYAHTLIDAAGGRAQPLVLNAAVAARLVG
jgi:Zn-dependent protease with chaperone function